MGLRARMSSRRACRAARSSARSAAKRAFRSAAAAEKAAVPSSCTRAWTASSAGAEACDQAGVQRMVAGEAGGRLLDLEHRRTRRERPRGCVPDLFEEGAAHHEHRIRAAERLGDAGGVRRDAPPVVGMPVGDRLVLMDELGPDAGAGRLGERQQGAAGVRARDIVADDDDGLGGPEEMLCDGGHSRGVRRGRAVERAGGCGPDIGLLLHDVDRQRDEDRAGGRVVGDLEGAAHDRRDLVGALGLGAPLDHRRRHGHQVVAEDGVAQAQPRVLLPGRDHHRRVGSERAEDHADGVAEAGRDMEVHHAGTAAGLGVVAPRRRWRRPRAASARSRAPGSGRGCRSAGSRWCRDCRTGARRLAQAGSP